MSESRLAYVKGLNVSSGAVLLTTWMPLSRWMATGAKDECADASADCRLQVPPWVHAALALSGVAGGGGDVGGPASGEPGGEKDMRKMVAGA